jgi:5-methyltetrahydrofolate--homocysteine methyltransferase
MTRWDDLVQAIQEGDFQGTETLVSAMLKEGIAPEAIIQEGIVKALNIVGKKFSEGECFIPEMLIAAKASQKGLEMLKPALKKTSYKERASVVIATVQGDLHDIGKNIVAMTLEAGGYRVVDLGVDVPPDKVVDTLQTEKASILALSCLITTTMEAMASTVKAVSRSGLQGKTKIMIGGPPTTEEFARKIGADFRGKDAYEALLQANRWSGAGL